MSENIDGLSDLIKKDKKISSSSENTEVKTTVEKSISIENVQKSADNPVQSGKKGYSDVDFEGESSFARASGERNKVEIIKEPIIEIRPAKTTKVVKVTTVETTTETSADNTLNRFFPKDDEKKAIENKVASIIKNEENTTVTSKDSNVKSTGKVKVESKTVKKEKNLKKSVSKKASKKKAIVKDIKTDAVPSTESKVEKKTIKKVKKAKESKTVNTNKVKAIAKTVTKSTVITSKEGAALERSMLVLAKQINTLADIFSIATKELKKDVEGEMIEKLDKILYENSIIAEALLTLLEEIKEDNRLNRSVIKKHIDSQEKLQPFSTNINMDPQISQKEQELYTNMKSIAVDRTEFKPMTQNTTTQTQSTSSISSTSSVSSAQDNEVKEIRNDRLSMSHKNIRDIFSETPSGYKRKTQALEIKGIPKINELPPSIDDKEEM